MRPPTTGVDGRGSAPDLAPDHQPGAEVRQAEGGPTPWLDRDHCFAGARAGHHLQLVGAGPQDGQGARGGDGRAGHGAVMDVFEPVGTVAPEPHGAAAVDRDPYAAAPAQPCGIAGNRLHLDRPIQAGQALQLLGDAEGLQAALGPQFHVLEVTAAAAPRPGMRAGGLDAVGRGGQDLDGVRPQEGGRAGGDSGPHPLAGQAVTDEDHLAVGRPGHAAPAGGDGAHLQLQDIVAVLHARPGRDRRFGHGRHARRA